MTSTAVAADEPGRPTLPALSPFAHYIDLGGIIAALQAEDPNRVLPIGFHKPHSFRGYYEQLAFEPIANITIGEMLDACRSALGSTFQGWKGGDYTMGEHTDCWIAEWGNSSDNQIGPMLLWLLLAQPAPTPEATA